MKDPILTSEIENDLATSLSEPQEAEQAQRITDAVNYAMVHDKELVMDCVANDEDIWNAIMAICNIDPDYESTAGAISSNSKAAENLSKVIAMKLRTCVEV